MILKETDKVLVVDIETERLHDPECIWVISTIDEETETITNFFNLHEDEDEVERFKKHVLSYDKIVGHNFLTFDAPSITSITGVSIPKQKIIDTLIISRLLNYNIRGGHSLDAWGQRLGVEKADFNDFSHLSDGMVRYCEQDVRVTLALFKKFKPYVLRFGKAIWLEQETALSCQDMKANGFVFDTERAVELEREIADKVARMLEEFCRDFPPYVKHVRTFIPKQLKTGGISKVGFAKLGEEGWRFEQARRKLSSLTDVVPYVPVDVYSVEPFNPSSNKHVIHQLWEWGWKPVNKTKGYLIADRNKDTEAIERNNYEKWGWKIDEENLKTLPEDAPESAGKLVEYLTLANRLSTVRQWLSLVSERDNRIHGDFLHIGSWTHRMAHRNPNMANIPAEHGRDGKKQPYGAEFRSLWTTPDDAYLLGTDAEGIQMRIFAHYTEDDDLIHALVAGKKEDKTDVHSLHAKRLGGVKREKAKTFIYAWLLGAGVKKVAEILECSTKEASERMGAFLASYPKLMELKNRDIPLFAMRGYFEGLDGRYVVCSSDHLMLAGMLQNGEAVVMKLALALWQRELKRQGIKYELVNFVHDEWQTYIYGDRDAVSKAGEIQADAIRIAGEKLGVKCPLAGSFDIGKNWLETH